MAEEKIIELAARLRAAIGGFVRRAREGSGTPSDARSETLGLLDRRGPLSAAALAKSRAVTHQSMRVVLIDLERMGLVESARDLQDGRGKLSRLTADGRQELHRLRVARVDWIAERLVRRLSDEDRRTLADAILILERLSEP